MAIFMQYGASGSAIVGDATSAGHEQWITLNSLSWGISRAIGAATGAESDREGTTPNVSEIVITKPSDMATNDLIRAALGGGTWGTGQTVQLDIAQTGTSSPSTYVTIILSNTLISGYSMSSGGDAPIESITLNFTEITVTYVPFSAANTQSGQNLVDYNLATQKLQS